MKKIICCLVTCFIGLSGPFAFSAFALPVQPGDDLTFSVGHSSEEISVIIGSRQRVCAKYQTRNGWSDMYVVDAEIVQGSELNRRTNTFNYSVVSYYVVIFWQQNQATLIKLDFSAGRLSSLPSNGADQNGRRWRVSSGSNRCFW